MSYHEPLGDGWTKGPQGSSAQVEAIQKQAANQAAEFLGTAAFLLPTINNQWLTRWLMANHKG